MSKSGIIVMIAILLILAGKVQADQCVNGDCQSWGEFVWDNGDRYEGEFTNYELTGAGVMTFANGDVYRGEFVDWNIEGKGRMTYANGEVYSGQFRNWSPHGRGTLNMGPAGTYTGEFVEGNIQGEGRYIYGDGSVYQGEFHDWSRHGQGTLISSDGKEYAGRWENDQFMDGDMEDTVGMDDDPASPPCDVTETEPASPQHEEEETQAQSGLARLKHIPLTVDHNAARAFDQIPAGFMSSRVDNFRILYGHTSHGSQMVTGMQMLQSPGFDLHSLYLEEPGGDLGHNGDLEWERITRERLGADGGGINLVVWSWCGGASDNTAQGIDTYLNAMDRLEKDYPGIVFVYMTGHLDDWSGGTVKANNDRIRQYCNANGKVLYDFADIESYDPAGKFYPNASDACEWCASWCQSHQCSPCTDCAHSHCFNCLQKGRAFWWLLYRLTPD